MMSHISEEHFIITYTNEKSYYEPIFSQCFHGWIVGGWMLEFLYDCVGTKYSIIYILARYTFNNVSQF